MALKSKLSSKTVETTITISRTIQLAQYEPLTLSMSERITVSEKDDIVEVRKVKIQEIYNTINLTLNKIKAAYEE
jgi:hypothetical protein